MVFCMRRQICFIVYILISTPVLLAPLIIPEAMQWKSDGKIPYTSGPPLHRQEMEKPGFSLLLYRRKGQLLPPPFPEGRFSPWRWDRKTPGFSSLPWPDKQLYLQLLWFRDVSKVRGLISPWNVNTYVQS